MDGTRITIAGVDKDTSGNPIAVQAPYGPTTITNSGLIKGDSDADIAFTSALASGFSNTITNTATSTIEGGGTTAVALQTGADNDTINNSGLIKADSSGKAIDMGAGNNTLNILGGAASIIGDISGGSGGTNVMTINPGVGNSFSYAGSISNFSTVEAQSGLITLSGVSSYTGTTKVTGGILTLAVANLLSSGSALDMNGGTLAITNAGGANGQTFASLELHNNSVIDLDLTSLTFNALGTIATGTTLTILDYQDAISPDYAFRFLGDLTLNTDFLSLTSKTTIDGLAVKFTFDGTYTDVVPVDVASVQEPPTFAIIVLGGLLLLAFRRKRC